MTPAPEKAAPIPAEVLALAEASLPSWYHAGYHVTHAAWVNAIVDAILADREARPSLPESREAQIREDERDRLLERARNEHGITAMWLVEEGAMLPADRARARQGGNNG